MKKFLVALLGVLLLAPVVASADTPAGVIWTSPNIFWTNGGNGTGGGSSAFSALTSSTNTSAAMLVGNGATLGPSGTGKVTANLFTPLQSAIAFADTPYSVTAGDETISCDATGGAVVINLPAATGTGRMLRVKKLDATANGCTLTRAGADTIDGATTVALTVQYAATSIEDSASTTWIKTQVGQLTGGVVGLLAVANGGTGADQSAIAKGGILVGTAAGTIGIKAVGTDAQVLTADAASAGGVKWAAGGGTTYALNPQTGATYTTTSADTCSAGTITNVGNAGTLTVTLLNDPPAGTAPLCACVGAAQSMVFQPSAGETMYFNGATAASVSCATIGCCITIKPITTGSGAMWIAASYSGPLS